MDLAVLLVAAELEEELGEWEAWGLPLAGVEGNSHQRQEGGGCHSPRGRMITQEKEGAETLTSVRLGNVCGISQSAGHTCVKQVTEILCAQGGQDIKFNLDPAHQGTRASGLTAIAGLPNLQGDHRLLTRQPSGSPLYRIRGDSPTERGSNP